nr:hypothetical protein [Tanacetum cinerariifolium]
MYYPRFTKTSEHSTVRCSTAITYKEYYAVATGAAPPKPKANVRKTRNSSDTTITPPTAVAGPRLTTSKKGKQAAKASKAKSLSALSEVAMTEAKKLKLATKRSLQQTHIPQAIGSGADKGTGSIPRVPNVPTDEYEEELSWNSTDEEADVPEIYMQEFWVTTTVHHHAIRFKMDNKKHIVNFESFRDMLHICLRVPGQSFAEPPFEEEIPAFIHFLRHSAVIRTLTDVNISKLYKPLRSFAAIINKCLTGKSPGYDSLKLSQAQIMWGLYHKRNLDYAYLMWEDFVYQVEHKDHKKINEMYYPRFTKVIIHHFMSKDPSIQRRNKVNWHYVRDDHMFSTIKLVSRHQNTQQFGPRLTTSQKGKQAAKASKAKSLAVLSDVAMAEAQQLKLVTKRKLQQTHISQASDSGADEGTGSIPKVLDVPTDESKEELSWNYSKDEGNDEGKDGDGDDDDDNGNGEEDLGLNVSREEGHDEEEEEDELYKDVNINQGKGIQATLKVEDSHVTLTPVNPDDSNLSGPLPMTAPIMTPSTIATITTTQQAPLPPTTAPSTIIQDLPNFGSLFGFDNRLRTLEANFSEFMQTNQFAGASDKLREEAQKENDEFLKTIDENVQNIIKDQVKEQVKTSYVVAADLSEMELKKILIKKIEGNKSIQRSNKQRNLYKALVEAYESDKIILDTYGETVTLKRRRDDDADKEEKPSAGSDRGSKRRR